MQVIIIPIFVRYADFADVVLLMFSLIMYTGVVIPKGDLLLNPHRCTDVHTYMQTH